MSEPVDNWRQWGIAINVDNKSNLGLPPWESRTVMVSMATIIMIVILMRMLMLMMKREMTMSLSSSSTSPATSTRCSVTATLLHFLHQSYKLRIHKNSSNQSKNGRDFSVQSLPHSCHQYQRDNHLVLELLPECLIINALSKKDSEECFWAWRQYWKDRINILPFKSFQ